MEIYVSGFFNRGQQNEYVELEAASKCSLEGIMLMHYHYGKDYLPVQGDTRVYHFPDINLRKGNLVRLYTFHHSGKKKEKDETLGKTVYNFSWNLDRISFLANVMLGAIDGRVNVIDKDGKTIPVEVAGVPQKVKDAVKSKDLDKAFALLLAESAK